MLRGEMQEKDCSTILPGRQSIQNRLQHVKHIREPWSEKGQKSSNNVIRRLLKKTFFSCHAQLRVN